MTPDDERELVGLLKSYGRLETMVGRVEERLTGTESDVTAIRAEHREAVKEFMGALKAIDANCGAKVDVVKALIEAKAREDRQDREKRKASGKLVVVAIIGACATVMGSIIAAATAIITAGP